MLMQSPTTILGHLTIMSYPLTLIKLGWWHAQVKKHTMLKTLHIVVLFPGNIGPPVSPRSQISLEDGESIYAAPNKMSFKRPCELWDVCLFLLKPYDNM